jgi:hypothetical protein
VADTTEHDTADRYEGLPETWSEGARETFAQVAESFDLDTSAEATLFHACALESQADHLDAQVLADGRMIPGSSGQLVLHPAISEARLTRVAAVAALRALGIAAGQSASSSAGARLAQKRWHGPSALRRVQ